MRKKIVYLLFACICLSLFSCVSDDFSLGSDEFSSNVHSYSTNECKVTFSTLKEDSFITNNISVGWLGSYHDPYTGTLTATPYFAFTRPDYTSDTETIYDSVYLYLNCQKDFFGDTTKEINFSVHRLNSAIKTNSNEDIYSSESFGYDAEALANFSLKPRPSASKKMKIKLSDNFGKDLYTKFMSDDKLVSTTDTFAYYFKGLALVPDTSISKSIVNLEVTQDSVHIVIYYHKTVEKKKNYEIDIISNSSLQFTHLNQNKSNTAISSLNKKYGEISSTLTKNQVFLQGITQTYVRMDFPEIKDIALKGDNVYIQNATLYIRPVKGSYTKASSLPSYIYLYYIDETDNPKVGAKLSLNIDYLNYDMNTYYEGDVSDLIRNQISAMGIDKLRVEMRINQYGSTPDLKRLVLGDFYNEKAHSYVNIKYSVYNDEN